MKSLSETSKDLIVICTIVTAFLTLFFLTLSHYGIGWDAALGEFALGDYYFYFLKSWNLHLLDIPPGAIPLYGQPNHPDWFATSAYAQVNRDMIAGFGPMLTALGKHIFFTLTDLLDPVDGHHAMLGILVAIQIIVMFYYFKPIIGICTSVAAIAFLISYPSYWSNLHYNSKDIPTAVLSTIFFCLFRTAILKRSPRLIIVSGILWGMCIATKANALFFPIIVGIWFLFVLASRWYRKEQIFSWQEFAAGLSAPLFAFGTLLICWPLLIAQFPEHILGHVRFLLDRGLEGPPHWQLTPLLKILYCTPPAMLIFTSIGCITALYESWQTPTRRELYLLLFLWMTVPVLRVSTPHSMDFDGIRHWIEFLPAMAIFAGIGLLTIARWFTKKLMPIAQTASFRDIQAIIGYSLLCISLLPTLYWSYKNHPYENVYFNSIIGGLSEAQAQGFDGSTDFWGISYRNGMRWLNQHAERRANIMVGLGEHILMSVEKIWLRPDLRALPMAQLQDLLTNPPKKPKPVYVMYATRPNMYSPFMNLIPTDAQTVLEIEVDGGVIMKIVRFTIG